MIVPVRINSYWYTFFEKKRTGISVNVTLSNGLTGIAHKDGSAYKIVKCDDRKSMYLRIGYTHPDFELMKRIFLNRDARLKAWRGALYRGQGKNFCL